MHHAPSAAPLQRDRKSIVAQLPWGIIASQAAENERLAQHFHDSGANCSINYGWCQQMVVETEPDRYRCRCVTLSPRSYLNNVALFRFFNIKSETGAR